MAPSLKKALTAFIADIPAAKLSGFPDNIGTIYNDADFRLDMQGLTSGNRDWNLQIQANKNAPNTSVASAAKKGGTVSIVIYRRTSTATAEEVRAAFKKSCADIPAQVTKVTV